MNQNIEVEPTTTISNTAGRESGSFKAKNYLSITNKGKIVMINLKLTIEDLDKMIQDEIEMSLLENQRKEDLPRIGIEDLNGNVTDYEDTEEHNLFLRKQERLTAIKGFQSFYRTLSHNQAYDLRKWLMKSLMDDLSLSQVEEITSRIISATKGLTSPINKNRKPK